MVSYPTFHPAGAWRVTLPLSKSVANRELVLDALAGSVLSSISSRAENDDIKAMRQGLLASAGDIVNVGGAGTALRFLTAYWACCPGGRVTLTGNRRLCERPIATLVKALCQMGADIRCAERPGCAPLQIRGRSLSGGRVRLAASQSSQFASALLMIGPTIGGLELELSGDIVSRPYIEMTVELLTRRGVQAQWTGNVIAVPHTPIVAAPAYEEGDWSAAAFWLALQALLPQARITLSGLRRDSVQGDQRIMAIMKQLGMDFHWHEDGTLTADMSRLQTCCCSTFADLTGTPDLAPILVVLLCLLGRPFRLTGLRTLRHKESDRIEALRDELRKLGYLLTAEGDDALCWHFATCRPMRTPRLDPHGDHRIAMALALAATRHPGIAIDNAEVTDKSYPDFWRQIDRQD